MVSMRGQTSPWPKFTCDFIWFKVGEFATMVCKESQWWESYILAPIICECCDDCISFLIWNQFSLNKCSKGNIIQRMCLLPNSLQSSVTTSLKDRDFGSVTLGLATYFENFLQTLLSLTTQWIMSRSSGNIHPAFLYAAISWSFCLCLFILCTCCTALKEQSSCFLSSRKRIPSSSPRATSI